MARTAASLLTVFMLLVGGAGQVWSGQPEAALGQAADTSPCPPEGVWLATSEGQWLPSPDCPPGGAPPEGQLPPGAGEVGNAPQVAAATGGPDEYGYTWDNSVPLNWIDATQGTVINFPSGYSGGRYTGPVGLPFPFKFYENTYNSLYLAASGYVGFTDYFNWPGQHPLLNSSTPNNLIAPYMAPFRLADSGASNRVHYLSGGTAPNRYFVVEWYQVSDDYSPAQNQYTFEVVLHENGDIVFQYHAMTITANRWCGYTGIEDSTGLVGLTPTPSCSTPPGFSAVRFTRPAPSARVGMNPRYQGQFTTASEVISYTVPIRNLGELGNDVFDLYLSSGWPATAYAADGVTPLTDTDGDFVMDTGSVAQGSTVNVVVKVNTPGGVALGDADTLFLSAVSTLNTSVSKTATLQSAVPAPFAQVFSDAADNAMTLLLAHPAGQAHKKATNDFYYGYYPAIAAGSGGQMVYAWARSRCLNATCTIYTYEIEYALLNQHGEPDGPITKLTDHSGASLSTYDYEPAVAIAPDGRIGLTWTGYQYNNSTNQYNYNVFFAILDAEGVLEYGPVNLTNNGLWGTSNDLFVPRFNGTRIVATGDNRFVVAWQQFHYGNPTGSCTSYCSVNDVYYAVRSTTGSQVQGVTQLTFDTAGYDDDYYAPNLAPLAGNRVLLSLYRLGNIYYAVLTSQGITVLGLTDLTPSDNYYNYSPDAVQLSNGNILVVWTNSSLRSIGYAVLNAGYGLVAGPFSLSLPAAVTGSANVSVAADGAGHGILTWTDMAYENRRHLYYALVNSSGASVTAPMPFQTSQAASPRLETSYGGYGNTSYSTMPTAGVDAWIAGKQPVPAVPGREGLVVAHYGNHGLELATNTVITVTLGGGLTWPTLNAPTAVDATTAVVADLAWLDTGALPFVVNVPNDPVGTTYPITLTIGTAAADANGSDNQVVFDFVSSYALYLPTLRR